MSSRKNLFCCLAAGWLSQNGRVCGRGIAPVVGLLSPGQNGAGNVSLAASVYVMEGRGTVSAGHGALRLHVA